MHVYSGVCRMCDVGIPSGMFCYKTEEELFTGDIVLLYSVEYAGTDFEFWNCYGLTVIVADQYTTYNGGDIIEVNPLPFKPFCMGVKSVDFPSDQWKLQRIKSFVDVIDGEHWPKYGFNYKQDGEK